MNYDKWLIQCYQWAVHSPDPSTQNAALLIDERQHSPFAKAVGINEFPWNVKYNDARWERPAKYYFVEHAERNVIYAASRSGISTLGLTMVCPWAACADCGRAIIQAGISKLVRHKLANDGSTTNDRWMETILAADEMMIEAGIKIVNLDSIPGYNLFRNGMYLDTGDL